MQVPQSGLSKLSALALTAVSLFCLSTPTHAADKGAPPSAKVEVIDQYGELKVSDPYRWLEQNNEPTRAWVKAQNTRSRKYLDQLPMRKPIFKRLMTQLSASSSSYYDLQVSAGQVFALFQQPGKQQTMIALLGQGANPATARVVVDPNKINPKGSTAIDWYVPSPDGKLLAVSMSENGSEDGSVHIFDVATGKAVNEVIPRVQYATAGGSLAWYADGSGFWYTRYPGPDRPAEEQHFFQQVYAHKLGTDPATDTYVIGKQFPKVAITTLAHHAKTNQLLVSVANGDGGEFAHYVVAADGATHQISQFADKVVAVQGGPDGALYLVSNQNAPRGKLLKLASGDFDLRRARVIVPESEAVLVGGGESAGVAVTITDKALYVRQMVGGPSRVAIFDLDGTPKGELPLTDISTVSQIVPLPDASLLYSVQTYLKQPYYARYDEATGKVSTSALVKTSPVRFDNVEVVREFATSKDGTKIPLTIVRRKGLKLDGSHPLLLNGYGGYNVSQTPRFLGATRSLWLDAGGVFVIANLRGGGEFGEAWHQQGMLANKQNVFDDFIASAEYLIKSGHTSSKRMAAIGGSNGGLLMGAVVTQRPELFRAVVSSVGIYDMLRVELDPNGAFNVTEFGSVKDPAMLPVLYGYSPYHHVKDGAHYPAMFLDTGETDGRVNPMHSRKMVARMQAATASRHPIFLSSHANAGHGMGSSLSVTLNQWADTYSFLMDQLGMKMPGKK
jgi:prolyl oligopeptidase